MSLWRGRRERGAAVVHVAAPASLEIVTGRLLEAKGDRVTLEDDAGVTRSVGRPRTFRPTPDQMARLRTLQVTERLLHDQLDALLAEMERV
jgi:hypothetical protein